MLFPQKKYKQAQNNIHQVSSRTKKIKNNSS